MIQQGTSRKVLIVGLIGLLLIFLGISVFIASRLQQDQAPIDSSAGTGQCVWINGTNCGSGCLDYFQDPVRSGFCCGGSPEILPRCPSNQNPPTPEAGCRAEYFGNSFRLIGTGCNSGYQILNCRVSYSGAASLCPTSNNCIKVGDAQDGNTYTTTPQAGECLQVDWNKTGDSSSGGGVCDCKPPIVQVQPPTATAAAQCPLGSTTPTANITWTLNTYPAQIVRVDISITSNFSAFWSKNVPLGTTNTNATGFTSSNGNLTLAGATTYYFRVNLLTSNIATAVGTFSTSNCSISIPSPTTSSICPSGSTTPNFTVNWTNTVGETVGYFVEISINADMTAPFWNKDITNASTLSTVGPVGFGRSSSVTTTDISIIAGQAYYVRVFYKSLKSHSPIVSFNAANCITVQPPTVSSICPSGSTNPTATINWSRRAINLDFDTNINFTGGFWFKDVNSITSNFTTNAPSGFNPVLGETQQLVLNSGTTYYVRVNYGNGELSAPTSFNAANCIIITAQCIDLIENGSDPIASGVGNKVLYTLKYNNSATTNPYPSIRLRVGPASTPVGRSTFTPTSVLIGNDSYSYDPVTSIHTYGFSWEAASPSGVAVPAGTYEVRALLDGTTAILSPVECLESITVSTTVVAEPLFNIVKTGSAVCEADGDSRIDYTITASNIGSVSGIIDFVEDAYDTAAASFGITPTNFNPGYGAISAGKIIWTGDVSARTYAAGQNKQFTYSLTIPSANLLTFINNGVFNQVMLQYDTSITQDNSVTFDLRTFLSCSTPSIPNTGIFDDARLLFLGMVFILAGIVIYKSKIGYQLSEKVVGSFYDSVNDKLNEAKVTFKPYEENILDDMENKVKGIDKKK